MKRIYMTLGLMASLATGAFAQRFTDVQITFMAPAEGTTITCGDADSFQVAYALINKGPETILTTDTFAFSDFESAYDGNGINLYLQVPTQNVAPGDTLATFAWNSHYNMIQNLFSEDGSSLVAGPFDNGNYMLGAIFQGFGGVDGNSWVESTEFQDTANNAFGVPVTLDCTTGIKDLISGNNNQSLNVYPNPVSNGTINFKYEFASATQAVARVTDISGRVVMTKDFGKVNGAQNFSLDVSALNAGLYMIELNTDQGKAVSKFSVQK